MLVFNENIFPYILFHCSLKIPFIEICLIRQAKDWRQGQVNGGFLRFLPLTADHNHHPSQVGQKKVEYLKEMCFDSFASV